MRNEALWEPSKFRTINGIYQASPDPRDVGAGSRLIGDLLAERYEDIIRKHAAGFLLDLGCGKAPLYGLYRNYVTGNVCLDWGNTTHGTSFLDCQADLNTGIPFRDGTFDTILVTDVLEHIWNIETFWSELVRVSKPMGKSLIGVPFLYWIHEAPHDYFRFTEFSLRRFAEQSGLQVLHLEPYGGALHVMLDMFTKGVAAKLPRLAPTTAAIARRVTHMGRRSATSRRFPLGYTLVVQKRQTES